MRVETPPGYPPEAASQLQKRAAELERVLLRRLGYSVPERLRTSPLVTQEKDLKIGKGPLSSRATYEIIDKIYADDDLTKDQERRCSPLYGCTLQPASWPNGSSVGWN
jgi:hypothetical protein